MKCIACNGTGTLLEAKSGVLAEAKEVTCGHCEGSGKEPENAKD